MDLWAANPGKGWKLLSRALTLSYCLYFLFYTLIPSLFFLSPTPYINLSAQAPDRGHPDTGRSRASPNPCQLLPAHLKVMLKSWVRSEFWAPGDQGGQELQPTPAGFAQKKETVSNKTHKGSFISGSSSTSHFGSDSRSKYPKFPYEIKLFQLSLKCCHYVGNVFPEELVPI